MESCPVTALGMRRLLLENCDIGKDIIHTNTLAEIMPLIKTHRPKLLLMDLCGESESVLDGLRLLSSLHSRCPEVKVVVCTAFSEYRILQLAVSSGAHGMLLKSEPTIAFVQCISQVMSGGNFYSPKLRQLLSLSESGKEIIALTRRELDVLTYLFSGMNVSSVAAKMYRDIRTISTHKRNAMAKLGFKNDSELFAQGIWMMKAWPGAVV
ncbi:response regulator transcription factor [Ewingella americana]|nr:response regulator transcription factor [Ewingella americana]